METMPSSFSVPLYIVGSCPLSILVVLCWTVASLSAIFVSIYEALQIAQSRKNTLTSQQQNKYYEYLLQILHDSLKKMIASKVVDLGSNYSRVQGSFYRRVLQ